MSTATESAMPPMTHGQRIRNSHLPKSSKKRRADECAAELDTGVEISNQWAQEIAAGIEAKFFEDANTTRPSDKATQHVWNELCKRPAIRHYDAQRCKGTELSHLTREQQSQLYAGAAAMQHVKGIRAKGAKMTSADKSVVRVTAISCSTGKGSEEAILGRQAEGFGYSGVNGKRKFRQFVHAKIKVDASDNRSLQMEVPPRKVRDDKIDGDPVFSTIFEANTDQVKGKRGTKRKYVGCKIEYRVCGGWEAAAAGLI